MRVGLGYDVHKLVPGLPLILGGVHIPFPWGLEGHSDADVLCHAIMDACLGAAALGDIGGHFPAGDSRYKNISSLLLLKQVAALLRESCWQLLNIDAVIVAQRPRLSPYFPQMRANIGAAAGLPLTSVSVKATTSEGLGFVGEERGVEARAVVLLTARPGKNIIENK